LAKKAATTAGGEKSGNNKPAATKTAKSTSGEKINNNQPAVAKTADGDFRQFAFKITYKP